MGLKASSGRKAAPVLLAIAALAVLGVVLVAALSPGSQSADSSGELQGELRIAAGGNAAKPKAGGKTEQGASAGEADDPGKPGDGGEDGDGGDSEPVSPEEAAVEAFDALTDKWMKPQEGDISMDAIEEFSEKFRNIPVARREECLQRALNLVPDDNVMLLVGILDDKSIDTALVQQVFNDILNRNEDVKKPILLHIFKDRTHPCWADAAWVLDATGQLPAKEKGTVPASGKANEGNPDR